VFNVATGRYVRLRIYILNLPADNPAQSEEASHIGGAGSHPCRRCKVGGPYESVETVVTNARYVQRSVHATGLTGAPGLDPHRDTPIEILHTILLGVDKYVWHSTHTSLKGADRALFATRLQSSNIDGLDIDPLRADYFLQYSNNLIGRHFKSLMQLMVFHVHGLVSNELYALTKAVGFLGAMLWCAEINDLELYLVHIYSALVLLIITR
jgi:hypothetical protein